MNVITIGREAGSDIVIDDPFITRVHMQLVQDDSGVVKVVDMGSTNGTFVNGRRIEGECILNPGDEVRIGHTILPWQKYLGIQAGNEGMRPNAILRQEQADYYQQPQKRSNNKAIYVILCMLLLLVAGVVIWYFVSKGSGKETTPDNTPTATSDDTHTETADEWNSDEALRAYEEEWSQTMEGKGTSNKRSPEEQETINDLLQKEFNKILGDVIKLGKEKCNAFSEKMGWGKGLKMDQFKAKAQETFEKADEKGKRTMIDNLKKLRGTQPQANADSPKDETPKGDVQKGDKEKTDSKVDITTEKSGDKENKGDQ